MIYYLKGEIIYLRPLFTIVLCQGVGYGVHIPLSVSEKLKMGQKAELYTRMFHRENEQKLYGFLEPGEAELFEYLCSLSGVGPAVSMQLLSAYSAQELVDLLLHARLELIKKIPKVGKTRAHKILFECQQRPQKLQELKELLGDKESFKTEELYQAIEALLQLGYRKQEIEKAHEAIKKTRISLNSLGVQELIRLFLRHL
ncbi:MAG: Holliday junction branch migration protein RuvA [Leptospiraceae bacterium]|nr:Holliday junction branch migration protein RuvA [Leptospiraceae bacterium]MDW8306609.1 Holliday junction branch migration protein RuvA [Leptospiraceae bacterium]